MKISSPQNSEKNKKLKLYPTIDPAKKNFCTISHGDTSTIRKSMKT